MTLSDIKALRRVAMDLLARREHSYLELTRKLLLRDYVESSIGPVLDCLVEEDLLSDARFAEAYSNMRRNRGVGPIRIQKELQERGVAESLIAGFIDPSDRLWNEKAREAQQKKFKGQKAENYEERVRQARFLEYRGFTMVQIQEALGEE